MFSVVSYLKSVCSRVTLLFLRLCKSYGLEGIYLPGSPALNECFKVFEAMLSDFLPNLCMYFKANNVKVNMVCIFAAFYIH